MLSGESGFAISLLFIMNHLTLFAHCYLGQRAFLKSFTFPSR